jgi:hypothetical protein
MTISPRVSKYFNETLEERQQRLMEEELQPPGKPIIKKTFPINNKTLAEAWKWHRYKAWSK